MRALSTELRRQLETAVVEGRRVAEIGVQAALESLGVTQGHRPAHLSEDQARLRRGLRAKQRQLGGDFEVLAWDAAYEQWHQLLFARFLAENGLLEHPQYGVPVTLADCDELADELDEPDGWSVAARFAAEILPGIFRLDDPCVQLQLAPEHRVALEKIVAGLPIEVFTADDSLGWVYQYWQSERKEQINASEAKIGGADLGPLTQLFTENYMVCFLLHNSLGAWWAVRHPDSPLVKDFQFLRLQDDGEPAAGSFKAWPDTAAEVTVMDPCCGSGHFLVEAFGMLWRMRAEEEGLDPVTAQDAVLVHNLFGLEQDPRCVQIATFAVALAAWKQGGAYRQLPTPNVACAGIPAKATLEEWTALADGEERLEQGLEQLHTLFRHANTLGSLIDPRRATDMLNAAGLQRSFDDVDFPEVAPLLDKAAAHETDDPATVVLGAHAAGIARAASLLSRTYVLVATNVPYLKRSRQGEVLADYSSKYHSDAKQDLALAMLDRILEQNVTGACVLPQGWLFMSWCRSLRERSLAEHDWTLLAPLGTGAFEAISGEVVSVVLGIFGSTKTNDNLMALRADSFSGAARKEQALREVSLRPLSQSAQLGNPDAKVILEEVPDAPLLQEYAGGFAGICSGDYARFGRLHWEMQLPRWGWAYQQSTVKETANFGGREHVFFWEGGEGTFVQFVRDRLGEGNEGSWIRGTNFGGRWGVAVSSMSSLPATIYTGELFDNNTAVIMPHDASDLAAIWTFAQSDEFEKSVRRIDTSIKVTNATFVKVPFEVERWRALAAEKFPDGLPKPWSEDPTQWLFEGRPEVATEPLQVGAGRLVGYRWPGQPESDDLDELVDDDGIVCVPAVGGELPAADRLAALLARAYGAGWSPGIARELLEQAGSKKRTLADWLRNDFFRHHCRVFADRPFVWHVTDGRKDGFSAIVNYHNLDRAGLEKLTYTYLGDWLERQRADAAEDVPGADVRVAAARELKGKLEQILQGEPPYDVYVRWKPLHKQPIGWERDLDDGVRLNIRPFVKAGVLAGPSSVPRVNWKKDPGKDPDGAERHNDLHYTNAQRREARHEAGRP
jgi:hypothetical protein